MIACVPAIPAAVPTSRLYSLWRSIRSRCERSEDRAYARYGAVGARVCRAWQSFRAFEAWALASGWKPGAAIVLRDRKRGYRPSNCTWGSRQEAARTGLTAFGETKSISAWARDDRAVVSARTIRERVRDGVAAEEAITAKECRDRKVGKARRYHRIDWKRVYRLRKLPAAEIARRLGNAHTAILNGLRDRGWLERSPKVRELEHGPALYHVWNITLRRHGSSGWPDFAAFHAWALRAGYAPGLAFARPDRSKPAGPRNALWLPERESWAYRRPTKATHRSQRKVRAFGETKGVAEWARDPRCVVTAAGLWARLERGMKPKDAITKRKRREADYSSEKAVTAWGIEKPIAAWARDRRAQVGSATIAKRLREGWKPEAAIGTGAFGRAW